MSNAKAKTLPCYPKRPKYYACRFTRLLFKACLANEIGSDAVLVIIVIVHTEDAKGYRSPVTFYNHQLAPMTGLSDAGLWRARAKAVKAGWLVYIPGAKGRAAKYWVTTPPGFDSWDDSPSDEGGSFPPTGGGKGSDSPRILPTGEENVGRIRGACEGLSSLPYTKETPSECGSDLPPAGDRSTRLFDPDESPTSDARDGQTNLALTSVNGTGHKPAAKRKAPTGIHADFIRTFCEAWRVKYGVTYPFNSGKDATAFAWFRSQLEGNLDLFRGVVERYLADTLPFVVDSRHDVGTLRLKFARWMINPSASAGETTPYVPPRLRPDFEPPLAPMSPDLAKLLVNPTSTPPEGS